MQAPTMFVRAVYQDVDTLDVRRVTAHLTEDCNFVFGNADPLVGHAAIADYIGGFMEMIQGMVHEVDECWTSGDALITRMRVTYTRKDGVRKSYPAAIIWRLRGSLIRDFRIYTDNSTLFS